MKVAAITASVRYSKALGDGQHKTIELSVVATLEPKDDWQEESMSSATQATGWMIYQQSLQRLSCRKRAGGTYTPSADKIYVIFRDSWLKHRR